MANGSIPTSGALPGTPQNTYLPPGQTPLQFSGPLQWGQGQWQGAGGGTQAQQFYAVQAFNNLFGRNPTQSELMQFSPYFASSDPNIANQSGGNQAIGAYFNQMQQQAQAPQQEAQALQQQIPIIQNLVNQQTQAASADLLNPQSPTYQQFSGLMNNMGITPSSGAFQAGLGGQIGQNANQAINAALGSVGLPLASTYSQGATAPFQQAMQQPEQLFGNNLQLQDFIQQMMAGEQVANQNKPGWGTQYGVPLGSAALQGAGQAGGAYLGGKSAVCMELYRRDLVTKEELHAVLTKLFRASLIRSRAILHYEKYCRQLVNTANRKGFEWSSVRKMLVDFVLEAKNSSEAVDAYAHGCYEICRVVGREDLWDHRIYQKGWRDSIGFWWQLFTSRGWWEIAYFVITGKLGLPNFSHRRLLYGLR